MKFRLVPALVAASCSLALGATAAEPSPVASTPASDQGPALEPGAAARPPPVRMGVMLGVGAPRALTFEGHFYVAERVLLGFEYGTLPSTTVGGVTVGMRAYSADLRVFPLRGAPFFLGARLGKQSLDAAASVSVASYGTYSGSSHQESWFFGPRLGLLWVSRPGFTIGTSVGLQIPLSHTDSTALPTGVPRDKVVPSAVDTLGGGGVFPTVDLLQIGVAF